MNLALFDFDGTLTNSDSYMRFIYTHSSKQRILISQTLLAPMLVGYKLGWVSKRVARTLVTRMAFSGRSQQELQQLGQRYADEVLPTILLPDMMQRFTRHIQRGDQVVIVSASLDIYMKPWCKTHGVDVICGELEATNGKLSGRYVGGDCGGAEKAKRVQQRYHLDDYQTIYAYGDTEDDEALLALADVRYYQGQCVFGEAQDTL